MPARVRSSWLASVTNRRSRGPESARCWKARWIWASIVLSVADSRPIKEDR
jgi:hypothetical protein